MDSVDLVISNEYFEDKDNMSKISKYTEKISKGQAEIHFCDISFYDKKMYFVEWHSKILVFSNIENDSFNVECFEWTEIVKNDYIIGISVLDKVILLSKAKNPDELSYFDKENKIVKYITIKNKTKEVINFRHDQVVPFGDYIYIINNDSSIIKYSQELNQAEFICQENYQEKQIGQIVVVNREVYIPRGNNMLIFSLETEKVEEINISLEDFEIETCCYDGDFFWLTTSTLEIIQWNRTNQKIITYLPNQKLMITEKNIQKYFRSYYENNNIWIFPCFVEAILCFDIVTKTLEIINIDGEEENEYTVNDPNRCQIQKYLSVNRIENKIYFLSSKTKNIYELDMNLKKINLMKTCILQGVYNKLFEKKEVIKEGVLGLSLKHYTEVIIQSKK